MLNIYNTIHHYLFYKIISAFFHAKLGLDVCSMVNNQSLVTLRVVYLWLLERVFGDQMPCLGSTSCELGKNHKNLETSSVVVKYICLSTFVSVMILLKLSYEIASDSFP